MALAGGLIAGMRDLDKSLANSFFNGGGHLAGCGRSCGREHVPPPPFPPLPPFGVVACQLR